MHSNAIDFRRIHQAWAGRVSGCLLGKPLELLSFREGPAGLAAWLKSSNAWPVRSYIPWSPKLQADPVAAACCLGNISRAEPDDDINYTVLALMLLESPGIDFQTEDVARAWLKLLPAGATWTAERAAYRVLLTHAADDFVNGASAGFDLEQCSDNEYNEWIGAQIRTDLYGWVCPGNPELAAELAIRDASLSHRGEGVNGAAFIAALGAVIPISPTLDRALDLALAHIPKKSEAASAVRFGRKLADSDDALERLHAHYEDLPPVHTLNNLALVIWALCSAQGDFSTAVGNAVAGGWDTDCNGATVGGLSGLGGAPIPGDWTRPWQGRIGVSLAGISELQLGDVVARTFAIAKSLARGAAA